MKKFCISVCLLLLCATGEAQTLTSVGTAAVASANDFATTAFQDPWDMNERTDLGWFLNGVDQPGSAFTSVSFANGIFSGTSAGGANVFFLLESGNPNAASVGKIGRNFPIDASTHRLIAFRASTSATSTTFFQWNRDTIYDTTTTRSNSITTTSGFRYLPGRSAHARDHADRHAGALRLGRHGQVPVDVLQRRGIGVPRLGQAGGRAAVALPDHHLEQWHREHLSGRQCFGCRRQSRTDCAER